MAAIGCSQRVGAGMSWCIGGIAIIAGGDGQASAAFSDVEITGAINSMATANSASQLPMRQKNPRAYKTLSVFTVRNASVSYLVSQ